MKKMEYIAPMEQIVKLEIKNALLEASGSTAPGGGGLDD